jgi:cytochrome P450
VTSLTQVARRLPLWTVSEMVGIDHSDQAGAAAAAYQMIRWNDPLMTALAQDEVEGTRLTDGEVAAFFVDLAIAGNDTTRNTISHALKALCDNPEQHAYLPADYFSRISDARRGVPPLGHAVMTFRRTATQRTDLAGHRWRQATRWCSSTRRRAATSTCSPIRTNSTSPRRRTTTQVSGGHYCVGASLARTQLTTVVDQLLDRVAASMWADRRNL